MQFVDNLRLKGGPITMCKGQRTDMDMDMDMDNSK